MKGKRRFVAAAAAGALAALTLGSSAMTADGQGESPLIPVEIFIEKSTLGNPFLGFDAQGNRAYGGDPSILVDGDTVYAYVGHDVAEGNWYSIPEYLCYSSKDLINWEFENVIMNMRDVSWALADDVGWASQVIEFKGKYYFLFCTTSNIPGQDTENCIGVAECDTPNGDFVCLDEPLILSSQTGLTGQWGSTGPANDIDPTAWVETDETGQERMYVTWGNANLYTCEVFQNDEGHLEVVDQNNNGIINVDDGDIVKQTINGFPEGSSYNEAPYLYRRQNEEGQYYGPYYLFYAAGYWEQMAYATSDDIMSSEWEWGGILMPPTATSNTNHMAVFDFKDATYFVYHNAMLEGGSGCRRSACITNMYFNPDGTIKPIPETSTGLSGFTSRIFASDGNVLAHENFTNTTIDADYPHRKNVMTGGDADSEDALWELEQGRADKSNDAYVSIQSYNKPGLYLSADIDGVILTQDADAQPDTAEKMTFRTLKGFAGYGVTFESVYMPGWYLINEDGRLKLTTEIDPEACTFTIESDLSAENVSVEVLKTKRTYTVGSELNTDDIRITADVGNGTEYQIGKFTTNASEIDMDQPGTQTLTVSCTVRGETFTDEIPIRIVNQSETWK